MLDAWTLQILVEVADSGSFSAAAEHLSMTQPAVSRQIGNLERQLGLNLFHRAARGVVPTAAGRAAVDDARAILDQMRAMRVRLKGFADLAEGHVRLAAFSSANTAFVPEAIRRFRGAYPSVTVTLEAVDSGASVAAVQAGRLDVALVTDWDRPELDGVETRLLMRDELRLALPTGHRLAAKGRVRLAELAGEAWIEGAHPDCLGPLGVLTEALGGPPRIAFTCDDWNGKQALVAAGLGITVLPSLAGPPVPSGVTLVRTDPPLPARRVFAVVAPAPVRTPAASAMLAVLTELAG